MIQERDTTIEDLNKQLAEIHVELKISEEKRGVFVEKNYKERDA